MNTSLSPIQQRVLQERSLVPKQHLANGGVGTVLLVSPCDASDVVYALKTLRFPFDADDEIAAMFCDEIRLLRRLNHPNIVCFIEGCEDLHRPYLLMEYVRGCDLGEMLRCLQAKSKNLPIEAAISVGVQVLRALSYLHQIKDDEGSSVSVIHRDLSPPNLLVNEQGCVKLTDFGIAVSEAISRQTAWDSLRGRFAYLSPEVASGKRVEARSDLFSWGLIMWELLMGRRLFAQMAPERVLEVLPNLQMPPLEQVETPWREGFETILMRVLEPDLARRATSAEEVLVWLESWLEHVPKGSSWLGSWVAQKEREREADVAVD